MKRPSCQFQLIIAESLLVKFLKWHVKNLKRTTDPGSYSRVARPKPISRELYHTEAMWMWAEEYSSTYKRPSLFAFCSFPSRESP